MALAKVAQFESEDKLADILFNFDHQIDLNKDNDHQHLIQPLIEILEEPEFSEKENDDSEEDKDDDEIEAEDSEKEDKIETSHKDHDEDEDIDGHISGHGEVVVQIGDQSPIAKEYSFDLPLVPGSEVQDEIEVEEEQKADDDVWSWKLDGFLDWLNKMMKNWPKHNGYDISGLERAISYGEALLKEISKAVRQDMRETLDVKLIEKARNSIIDGVERLKDRLEKLLAGKSKKKKASFESGFVKEARAGRGTGDFVISIPALISGVARICINSTVSAGKDIEDTFHKMAKKLKLDEREQFQLAMLIEDMGYPLRRDRGILLNEEFDPTSSENFDYMPNYPA